MKNVPFLAAAVAVAVSTLPLASCTKQEQPSFNSRTAAGVVELRTGYQVVENSSASMVTKANAHHAEIVDAIASCNPSAIPITATQSGTNTVKEFNTGESITLKTETYLFSATYCPSSAVYLNSGVAKVADAPFVNVSTTSTVTAETTELVFPATYDCYAVVAPAAQCGGFKVYCGSWTDAPSVVSGDYRIVFLTGTFENSHSVMCLPASEDYLQKQFNAPKTAVSKGKYFYAELPASGVSVTTGASFSDWEDGWF